MLRICNAGHIAALLLVCGGLGGCSAASSSPDRPLSENAGSVRVPLTALGNRTMTPFKLGPATFEITGQPGGPFQPLTVSADGNQDSVVVPLNPGYYSVLLLDGWTLQQGAPVPGDAGDAGDAGTVWTPVDATLTSTNPQTFSVNPYQSTDVTFDFHLGESAVNLGISVDEGPPPIPAGYSGVIWPTTSPPGEWQITFTGGGGACCYATPAAAQAAYPYGTLFVSN